MSDKAASSFGMPGFGMPSPFDNPVASTLAGMDFVKSLWGGAGAMPSVAGFVAPTLDLADLDRKISDLKSVEQWLSTNGTMLRATIQALEVQRNTIAMLKSFAEAPGAPPAAMSPEAARRAKSGLPEGWPGAPERPHAAPDPAPSPAPAAAASPSPVPAPSAPAPEAGDAAKPTAKPTASASASTAAGAAQASIANAAAWWTMLQDQFAKVASAAVTPPRAAAAPSRGKVGASPAPSAAPKVAKRAKVTKGSKVTAASKVAKGSKAAKGAQGANTAKVSKAAKRPDTARKTGG